MDDTKAVQLKKFYYKIQKIQKEVHMPKIKRRVVVLYRKSKKHLSKMHQRTHYYRSMGFNSSIYKDQQTCLYAFARHPKHVLRRLTSYKKKMLRQKTAQHLQTKTTSTKIRPQTQTGGFSASGTRQTTKYPLTARAA